MKIIYLASPYSHPTSAVRYERFLLTRDYVWKRITLGESIFSPIVYCHQFVQMNAAGTDAEAWRTFNEGMMHCASIIRVLRLPDWGHSKGIAAELFFAEEHNILVEFVDA